MKIIADENIDDDIIIRSYDWSDEVIGRHRK